MQATIIPVRWRLHLVSQLSVIVYYVGMNTVLNLWFSLQVGNAISTIVFALDMVVLSRHSCIIYLSSPIVLKRTYRHDLIYA
jgi:hypothetical protein